MSSTLLHLDSADRSSGTSTDFTITLPRSFHRVAAVSLESATIPNVLYNVKDGENIVPVHISSVTYNAILQPGRYNIGTLTSGLQTAINNAVASTGVVFAVSVNLATFRLTISATSAFSLYFSEPNVMAPVLGFPSVDTAVATSATGSEAIQLNLPSVICISIREMSHDRIVTTGRYAPTFLGLGWGGMVSHLPNSM